MPWMLRYRTVNGCAEWFRVWADNWIPPLKSGLPTVGACGSLGLPLFLGGTTNGEHHAHSEVAGRDYVRTGGVGAAGAVYGSSYGGGLTGAEYPQFHSPLVGNYSGDVGNSGASYIGNNAYQCCDSIFRQVGVVSVTPPATEVPPQPVPEPAFSVAFLIFVGLTVWLRSRRNGSSV